MGNEQADGTGLPNSSRETKFSGANADRKIFIFPVQLTTSRIGNLDHHTYAYAYCTLGLFFRGKQRSRSLQRVIFLVKVPRTSSPSLFIGTPKIYCFFFGGGGGQEFHYSAPF